MRRVAIYARVSGDRQAREETIDSQIGALRERVKVEGEILTEEDVYVDDGVRGTTLVRPALERLRDRAAQGGLDRLYIHHPDRLARKSAYQALLIEEFARAGVEVVFLKGGSADSPEGALLVQIQGVIAEYERANIMERTRRGKLHRARMGEISVLGSAPHGYRYVGRSDAGAARYEVVEPEAGVVQRIFRQFVAERRSIGDIRRDLTGDGIRTPSGKSGWTHHSIWNVLKNPAYMGLAAFGRTREWASSRPMRRGRRRPPSKNPTQRCRTSPEEWIRIPVPAIIAEDMYERAQERLRDNMRFSPRNAPRGRYLLRGLVVCASCRYAYHGKKVDSRAGRKAGSRFYYRCSGTEPVRFEGRRVCSNRPVRADALERAVWDSMMEYLRDPERVVAEFRRRQQEPTSEGSVLQMQQAAAERTLKRSRRSLDRLIEAYEAGIFSLQEVQGRVEETRRRITREESRVRGLEEAAARRREWQEVITRVEEFSRRVEEGLAGLSSEERQEVVRLLVDRVEVGVEEITIVHRVPIETTPSRQEPGGIRPAEVACPESFADASRGSRFPLDCDRQEPG